MISQEDIAVGLLPSCYGRDHVIDRLLNKLVVDAQPDSLVFLLVVLVKPKCRVQIFEPFRGYVILCKEKRSGVENWSFD